MEQNQHKKKQSFEKIMNETNDITFTSVDVFILFINILYCDCLEKYFQVPENKVIISKKKKGDYLYSRTLICCEPGLTLTKRIFIGALKKIHFLHFFFYFILGKGICLRKSANIRTRLKRRHSLPSNRWTEFNESIGRREYFANIHLRRSSVGSAKRK